MQCEYYKQVTAVFNPIYICNTMDDCGIQD